MNVDAGAAADSRRPRVGEVMVEAGLLTPEQLEHALAEQRRLGRPLGEVIVGLGLASAGAVANALAEQYGAPLRTEHGFAAGLGLTSGTTPPRAPTDERAQPEAPAPAEEERAYSQSPALVDERAHPQAPALADERAHPQAPAVADERAHPQAPALADERTDPQAPPVVDEPMQPEPAAPREDETAVLAQRIEELEALAVAWAAEAGRLQEELARVTAERDALAAARAADAQAHQPTPAAGGVAQQYAWGAAAPATVPDGGYTARPARM